MSNTLDQFFRSYAQQSSLAHNGVKGMHWGVVKDQSHTPRLTSGIVTQPTEVYSTTCKNGTELHVIKNPPSKFSQALAKRFTSSRESIEKLHQFTLTDKSGAKVGQASFIQTSKTQLDLEWVGIDKSYRRNGYARAALKGVIKYSEDNDITKLVLTSSKMAEPLYTSLGFKPTGEGTMEYNIAPKVKHSDDLMVKSLADYIKQAIDSDPDLNK